MKELFLNQVCNIRIGISNFKKGKETDNKYYLIQLKDLNDDGIIDRDLKVIYIKNVQAKHVVKKDEIIFKAKSVNNVAGIIKEDGKFITTFHFLILTLNNKEIIIPEYLCWYLNQKFAQIYFRKIGVGSVQPIITKQDLGRLKIIVPPIKTQCQIVDIHNLWVKEKQLLKEKIEIKDKYIKEMLETLIKS